MDGGEYSGPIILKNSTVHQGLTVEAAGPVRPTLIAAGHKNAVLTCEGIAGLTLRGVNLKSRADQFSLSIIGFNPGLTLQDLEFTKADPPPAVGFWSHAWLGNGARGEAGAPIVFDRCRFNSWLTGLVLQGNPGGLISDVMIRGCRFETRLRQLELIAPVRTIRIVGNLFLDGSDAIILDSLSGESGDVVLANNTFWRIRNWLTPPGSAANVPEMAAFNNALVESTMSAELATTVDSLAKSGWRFDHNLAESGGTREPSDGVVEFVHEFEFKSRDPGDPGPDFLRPTPRSILARAGAGGHDPPYVGALEPARQ